MTEKEQTEGIAIIGMAGRFPGARSVEEYWQNLCDGVESIKRLSDDELLAAGVLPAALADPSYVKAAPVLEDIDKFDAAFFGFSPAEARMMDPQHRLFLECAWEALEAAGCNPDSYDGRIGVFGACAISGYLLHHLLSQQGLGQSGLTMRQIQLMFANDKDYLTTRVSHRLNLRGPSMSVQTACSSSLVAVHLACQSIFSGECDIALAGGVSLRIPNHVGYYYEEGSIVSPDGHCRPFDAEAKGTVFGSGVGLVVLKHLADALRDGDHIHAVIRGSAINNDGSLKIGYTAPSVQAQAEVIAEALAVAGVEPKTVGYVEAHGTGTPLGDPVEIAALTKAFALGEKRRGTVAIGSVKANIGHLEVAAGVAGLIKTALALERRLLPPSLHFTRPNPKLEIENSPFYVNDRLREWTSPRPLRAGITSLGAGGTNVHVVLEEAPETVSSVSPRPYQLLVQSAKTDQARAEAGERLAAHLRRTPNANLADVAYTLHLGRKRFSHRQFVVAKDALDAADALSHQAAQRLVARVDDREDAPVAFLFPGQGTQYPKMALELYQTEPIFRQQVDRCADLLRPHLGLDVRDIMFGDDAKRLEQTMFAQPALFTVSYALAQQWIAWGIRPQSMVGHSIGEYVAACLAGVFSLEDALRVVAARGALMQQTAAGAMLSVPLGEAELGERLAGTSLSLAAVNEMAGCVVSGPGDEVDAFARRLEAEGVLCRRLHTSHAFHSALMEPVLEPFAQVLRSVTLRPPGLPFLSNVTGGWITAEQATDPDYWVRQLRGTVRFADNVGHLLQNEALILLETGPGRSLTTFAKRHPLYGARRTAVPAMRHAHDQQSDVECLLTALGKLWLAGVSVDWQAFYSGEQRKRVPLPTYPFQRKRYWVERAAAQPVALATSQPDGEFVPPVDEAEERTDLPDGYMPPSTPEEQAIAAILEDVLGVKPIGLNDNFFDLGGDSVLALQVVARVQALGFQMNAKQLFLTPTVAELAASLTAADAAPAAEEPVAGPVPLTPSQRRFFRETTIEPGLWNIPMVMTVEANVGFAVLEQGLRCLVRHHDALRLRFWQTESGWESFIAEQDDEPLLAFVDLSPLSLDEREEAIRQYLVDVRDSFVLTRSQPLIRGVYFHLGEGKAGKLALVVHHLLADIETQRILLEDWENVCRQLLAGKEPVLGAKTSSYKQWSDRVASAAFAEAVAAEREYWLSEAYLKARPLPTDTEPDVLDGEVSGDGGQRAGETYRLITRSLNREETAGLLEEILKTHRAQADEILLAALARLCREWTGHTFHLVDVQGHGRHVPVPGVNLARTAGWFTTIYPVLLEAAPDDPIATIRAVKERFRSVPGEGIGYGLLGERIPLPKANWLFAYLGYIDRVPSGGLFVPVTEGEASFLNILPGFGHALEIRAYLNDGCLRLDWLSDPKRYAASTVERLASRYLDILRQMFAQTAAIAAALTPSDFPAAGLSQDELNDLLAHLDLE